jgi:hypothetical protein
MEAGIRPSEPVKLNFNFPSLLALYFAGPAGETFSFFGNVLLLGPANTLVLDRAYGQFRLVPEEAGANWLNLKIGRIDTRAEPFASTFRRTTAQGFNVGEYRTLSDGFSFRDRDSGVELWGAATGPDNRGGLEYGVGILQGTAGKSENNNFKDQYWSVLYKFGGFGTVGSRDDRETLTLNNNYSEWSFAAGTFGYRGKGQTSASDVTENQFERVGMKFDAYLDDLNLFGAIVSGRDHLEGIAPRRIDTSAFFVQADYMLLPWVMPTLRFEKTKYSDGRKPVREVIAAANIALRANVRVLLEGHFYGANTGKNEGMIRFEFLF